MTRVLLVSANQERRPYPVPPLGLCLLAQRLSSEYEVRVFDGMFASPDSLRRVTAEFSPDVVGLGVRNVDDPVMVRPRFYLDDLRDRVVRVLRQTTDAPLILGGSGYSIFPWQILGELEADYGVIGEGEQAFVALIEALTSGHDPSAIAGVVSPGGGLNPPSLSFDLGDLGPSQLERWIDLQPYLPRSAYPIQTKRGCGHRCVYCTYPCIEGRRFRTRSPEAIADELEAIHEQLGDITFEFVDSIFNDPQGHAEGICRELIRRGLNLHLRTMGLNPRGITAELLDLMIRAGFVQMDCTPDSASPAVLSRLGKGFTRPGLEVAAGHIRDAGLPTIWFFLFGAPGETEESFAESFDFIDRFVDPRDMVHIWAGLRIYPGTLLEHEAVRQGIIDEGEPLLRPKFYVSPELGRQRCTELIEEACRQRPNCVPAWEAEPDEQMLRQAFELRAHDATAEPMFRTFIRLRRQRMNVTAHL